MCLYQLRKEMTMTILCVQFNNDKNKKKIGKKKKGGGD